MKDLDGDRDGDRDLDLDRDLDFGRNLDGDRDRDRSEILRPERSVSAAAEARSRGDDLSGARGATPSRAAPAGTAPARCCPVTLPA